MEGVSVVLRHYRAALVVLAVMLAGVVVWAAAIARMQPQHLADIEVGNGSLSWITE